MATFIMEWDRNKLTSAISMGFDYFEKEDEIIGFIYLNPRLLKPIVLASPNEIEFDYIPEGIGRVRTAYLKYRIMSENEIRFVNQTESMVLRMILV